MDLSGLLPLLRRLPAYEQVLGEGSAEPLALLEAARPYIAAGLATHRAAPLVILTTRAENAQRWLERLPTFLPPADQGGPPIFHFADPDALPYERIFWTDRTRQQRLTALAALQSRSGPPPIIVASACAVMQKSLPAKELRMALRTLSTGSFVRLEEMLERWAQTGYNPVEVVEEPGTFARRGGIIDIWPPNLPHPVRIDLFGDEVESLRIFDPASQRSERRVDRIEIGPGSEALSKYGPKALERMRGREEERERGSEDDSAFRIPHSAFEGSVLDDPRLLLAIREEVRQETDHLAESHSFRGIEWYIPYFYSRPASLLDHLPDNAILLIEDGAALVTEFEETTRRNEQIRAELIRSGELPENFASSFFTRAELVEQIRARKPLILGFGDLDGHAQSANTPLARAFLPGPSFGGETKRLVREIEKYLSADHSVVLISRQAARIQEELTEAQIPVNLQPDLPHPPARGVTLLQGIAGDGFVLRAEEAKRGGGEEAEERRSEGAEERGSASRSLIPNPPPISNLQSPISNLHLLTDAELFGWRKPAARKSRRTQSSVAPELFFSDVKPGDYVVHMEHGIGQYEGLVQLMLGGAEREYLQVNYAQGDKLYVPVHQADRLSRYVGAGDGGVSPAVTRLGTADWQIVKERAKKAVEDIAEDLLTLYAEREIVPGYAYSPDTPWQDEMEAAFPFQETEDQLRAIDDVKRDMESEQPMDRIIIGDVGYGKTEVAIRAAFKAVSDSKQVAVLVPTTVLAQQHYRTFSRRLAAFPLRVEMLSRFRTQTQQEAVLKGLREGSVDIVIGTHRLLSNDIEFRDLGLLVVDEEQRFGVSHKERLKQLRTQVDVLTLSATPIPRTLHMSLSGVRDMSTISTPPQERLPVRTVLSEYDEVLVKQAIQREIDREGQVFFVHNRVQGIEQIAARIHRLVPEAVVGVGHGQMTERDLEEVMIKFADGEIDVLVCTTIVENGLDIRRANTMIINRADHFGLAQLYQLRGRVGRGAVRGYCYLLYDKHMSLSFDARRRLEALLESSEEMGAGFRIAMRDLEIRGAGELLGSRQHGQIAAVGFDLYTRLLTQAINEMRDKRARFERMAGSTEQPDPQSQSGRSAPSPVPSPQSPVPNPLPFALNDPLAPPVTLDLPFVAEIPDEYVPEENLRLQLYRRIAGLITPQEIEEMKQELLDRFGKDPETDGLPEAVENLFYQILVKTLALKAGIPTIGRRRDQVAIFIEDLGDSRRRKLQQQLRMDLGHTDDAGDFISENSIHVGREAVYIPIDEDDFWRLLLVRALEVLAVEVRPQRSARTQEKSD
jgi:transcription-repair coupling factor (superfamily II helicase)